jgi:hypothetical protein
MISKRCAITVSYSHIVRYCTSYTIHKEDAHNGWVEQYQNDDTACTAITLINVGLCHESLSLSYARMHMLDCVANDVKVREHTTVAIYLLLFVK